MKIVIVTSQVINKRNYDRFALRQLEELGDVVIIDITQFMYPKIFESQYFSRKKNIKATYLKSMRELEDMLLKEHDLDYLVSLLGNINEDNYSVYELLIPFRDRLCVLALSGFPSIGIGVKDSVFKRLSIKIKRESSLRGVIKKLLYFFRSSTQYKGSIKARYLMSCGASITAQYSKFIGKETEILKSCSYDYVLSLCEYEKYSNSKYMVFLDENLINHTDFSINDVRVEDEKQYYQELQELFSYLETQYSLKVIVAAHPRSKVEYTKSKLPDYDVVIGETAGLVKHSEACITHASTSSNFAVIFNRPIIFVTSDRMQKTRRANDILASWFGRRPVNMSHSDNYDKLEQHMSIDGELYDRFFFEFISYSRDCEYGYKHLIN